MIPVYNKNGNGEFNPSSEVTQKLFLTKLFTSIPKLIIKSVSNVFKLGFNTIKFPVKATTSLIKEKFESTKISSTITNFFKTQHEKKIKEKEQNEQVKNLLSSIDNKLHHIKKKFEQLINVNQQTNENIEKEQTNQTEKTEITEKDNNKLSLETPEFFIKKITKTIFGSFHEDKGLIGFLSNPGKWLTGIGLVTESPIMMMIGEKLSELVSEHKQEIKIYKEQLKTQKKEEKLQEKEAKQKKIQKNLKEGEEGIKEVKKRNKEKSENIETQPEKRNLISRLFHKKGTGEEGKENFFSQLLQFEIGKSVLSKIGGMFKKIPGIGKTGELLKKIPGIGKLFKKTTSGTEILTEGEKGVELISKLNSIFGKGVSLFSKALPFLGKAFGLLQVGEMGYGTIKGLLEKQSKYKNQAYDSSKHGFFSRVIHGILYPEQAVEGLVVATKGGIESLYDKLFKKSPEEKLHEKSLKMVKMRTSPKAWFKYKKLFETSKEPIVELNKLYKTGQLIRETKNKHAYFVLPSEIEAKTKIIQSPKQINTITAFKGLRVSQIQKKETPGLLQQIKFETPKTTPTINIKPTNAKDISINSDDATINVIQNPLDWQKTLTLREPAKRLNLSPKELQQEKKTEQKSPIIINANTNNQLQKTNTTTNDFTSEDYLYLRIKNHFQESKINRFGW